MHVGSKRELSFLWEYLDKNNYDSNNIKNQI